MAEGVALLRLMTWLSPAFPVGAFAYSHGLERAIEEGLVRDRATLAAWLRDLVEIGSGWNDAVLLAAAWRASSTTECGKVAELAAAMAGSRERHLETTQQGEAFAQAMAVWEGAIDDPSPEGRASLSAASNRGGVTTPGVAPPRFGFADSALPSGEGSPRGVSGANSDDLMRADAMPYPVAVGLAARRHGVSLEATLAAYLHAFASNLIQAAVRLVPLGQRDGVATLASLEPLLLATARRAAASSLDDLGSCTFMSEIMSMRHETQYSRVFRT